jgi:hypothetical protein
MPLPRTGDSAEQIEAWIEEAALDKQALQNLTRADEKGKRVVFARAYERQPNRATAYPTAGRCLKAISRMEITVTRVESGNDVQWHLTELPPLLNRIMKLLHLSPTLYTRLTKAAA